MCKWFERQGANSDIVISSRVRLARNVEKYPFSKKITDEQATSLVEEVLKGFDAYEDEHGTYSTCQLIELSENEKLAMVEQHLLSNEISSKKQITGLVLSEDESAAIMVNEEDHLRIQVLAGGMNMEQAYKEANGIDDFASEQFGVAFSEKYGYLTSCPTNAGTGLKASYMVFLPALGGANKINRLADEVAKYGITMRNVYGDGTEGAGHIYEIFNQKTMGTSETDIISNLNSIVGQIIKQERKRREYLLANNYDEIEDQVYRSYGVLKYTKQINTKDAMVLLSQIKFGADTNIIKFDQSFNLYKMIMEIQPYTLQSKNGKYVGNKVRDKLRAQYLNRSLPEIVNE